MKYRKKPVVVEAWLFDSKNKRRTYNAIKKHEIGVYYSFDETGNHVLRIPTLEGEMTARLGDYIIKGVKGELYPCKPDIFAATYEEVKE
jgi:hypothetical protein